MKNFDNSLIKTHSGEARNSFFAYLFDDRERAFLLFTLIFLNSLLFHLNHYFHKLQTYSISVLVYEFLFEHYITGVVGYSEGISFILFITLIFFLLLLIFYIIRVNRIIGSIGLFLFILNHIAFIDAIFLGL